MKYATLITYGFLYSKDKKMIKTFSTYDTEDEVFSGRNVFPTGCIKKMKKILI